MFLLKSVTQLHEYLVIDFFVLIVTPRKYKICRYNPIKTNSAYQEGLCFLKFEIFSFFYSQHNSNLLKKNKLVEKESALLPY